MSTVHKLRYLLAAASAFTAIGLMLGGHVLVGAFCLITAVLFLPIVYQRLLVESNEVQFLSPILFLVVTLFSFMTLQAIPQPYTVPLQPVYVDSTSQTTTTPTTVFTIPNFDFLTTYDKVPHVTIPTQTQTIIVTQTTTILSKTTTPETIPTEDTVTVAVSEQEPTVTTVQTVPTVGNTVYRTPSGKRYHLDPMCGGKNSYEVSYDEAIEAGLTPCKKCAGG